MMENTLQPIVEYFNALHLWINVDVIDFVGSGANLFDVNGSYHVIDFLPNGDPNVWNHIAVTYDGLTGEAAAYLNGVLMKSLNLGIFTPKASGNIYIGHRESWQGTGPEYYFNGSLSEVRLWDVVRTASQIVETMNVLLSPEYYQTADSGLVGYWRLDQLEDLGVGNDGADDFRDLSFKQNHGDSYGNPNIVTDIQKIPLSSPNNFLLCQNYPNPFNPSTTINYSIPNVISTEGRNLKVTLKVYDVLGNEVATLVDEYKPAGIYSAQFTMKNLTSGIYFYKLSAGDFVETKKMILLK